MRWIRPLAAALLSGCAVTPLTNKIAIGDDPYVIVVGEGADGNTDLFAAPAAGGAFYRFTYNRPVEALPRLAPDGKRVAFVRRQAEGDLRSTELVVLDLTTMSERRLPVPENGWKVERLGWSADGTRLFIRGPVSYVTPAPPTGLRFTPLPADSAAVVDTLTSEALGGPPYALVRRCGAGQACIVAGTDTTSLGSGIGTAIRWGADSLGYLRGSELTVRPLRGGHQRSPSWVGAPANLRDPTLYPGSGDHSIR